MKRKTCLVCEDTPTLRGLCGKHYNAAAQLVHRRQTTWAKLERNGKVNKQGKRGPKVSRNKFLS